MLDDLVIEPETQVLLLQAFTGYITDAEFVLTYEPLTDEEESEISQLLQEFYACRDQLLTISGKSKEETRKITRNLKKKPEETVEKIEEKSIGEMIIEAANEFRG